jgi:hypothetical protein
VLFGALRGFLVDPDGQNRRALEAAHRRRQDLATKKRFLALDDPPGDVQRPGVEGAL